MIAGPTGTPRASALFDAGVRLGEVVKMQRPSAIVRSEGALVASYTRRNGSGTPVLSDPRNGNWLVAVGTWFHDDGYGSGQEQRLLERFGELGAQRLAQELEGFFLIAAGDGRHGEVTVITDLPGTLHCYTRELDGLVAISTSSLVLAGLADTRLDEVGCQEFLQTGAMYEDRTFYREVRKLEAARCHRFAAGRSQGSQRYWKVEELAADSLDGSSSVAAMREAVVGAARRIQATFANPVVDLTAGYDSRAGVAAFLTAGVPFKTAVAGDPGSPDVVISNRLARRAGLEHRSFEPRPVDTAQRLDEALQLTDGEYDLVDYARIHEVQSDLAARFDISINSYSGEIGRGYGWEVLWPHTGAHRPLDPGKVARRRFVNPNFDASIVAPALRIDPAEHFRGVVARTVHGLEALPNTLQYDWGMTMLRCQRWYGRIASSTDQLWPCMSFFLLRTIVVPMLTTTTRSRERSLLFRRLLADTQPALAEEPLDLGYPPLPVSWRTLHRFWPILPLYGGKVVNRVRRRIAPPSPDPAAGLVSPRIRLWQDPQVRELLAAAQMESTAILEPAAVGRFLQASRQPVFGASGQWALLLSLELTLRKLKAIRAPAVQATPEVALIRT